MTLQDRQERGGEHGERRNGRQEVTTRTVERTMPNVGAVRMPLIVASTPVEERWCAHCEEWQEQRGILETIGLFGCPRCGTDWPNGPEGAPA